MPELVAGAGFVVEYEGGTQLQSMILHHGTMDPAGATARGQEERGVSVGIGRLKPGLQMAYLLPLLLLLFGPKAITIGGYEELLVSLNGARGPPPAIVVHEIR